MQIRNGLSLAAALMLVGTVAAAQGTKAAPKAPAKSAAAATDTTKKMDKKMDNKMDKKDAKGAKMSKDAKKGDSTTKKGTKKPGA